MAGAFFFFFFVCLLFAVAIFKFAFLLRRAADISAFGVFFCGGFLAAPNFVEPYLNTHSNLSSFNHDGKAPSDDDDGCCCCDCCGCCCGRADDDDDGGGGGGCCRVVLRLCRCGDVDALLMLVLLTVLLGRLRGGNLLVNPDDVDGSFRSAKR